MIISGDNLYLRFPNKDDIDILFAWENDREIWSAGDHKSHYTKEEISSFVLSGQDLLRDNQMRCMICNISNHKALGCIDLYEFNRELLYAGVGILIYDKNDRNKGFGKEALSLLIEYSSNQLKLNHLFCRVLENNAVSRTLFTSNGFTFQSEEYNNKEQALQITLRRQFN